MGVAVGGIGVGVGGTGVGFGGISVAVGIGVGVAVGAVIDALVLLFAICVVADVAVTVWSPLLVVGCAFVDTIAMQLQTRSVPTMAVIQIHAFDFFLGGCCGGCHCGG